MGVQLGVISRATRHRYIKQLKEVLAHCLRHDVTAPLRRFCRDWIRRGAPVDPKVLYLPTPSLRVVVRQVAAAFPSLGAFHADARLWLREPEARCWDPVAGAVKLDAARFKFVKPYADTWIPFNLTLYAPRGTPYGVFNRVGFVGELA